MARLRHGQLPVDGAAYRSMHDEAHERCFIANSVKTEVLCEPAVER